jgi:AAA-like domain
MNIDKALETVEQIILSRELSPIERLILRQSWVGKTYTEMSEDCGYGSTYIKEVGSQLWNDLSKALGSRVTKKNLHLVLSHYPEEKRVNNYNIEPRLYLEEWVAENNSTELFSEKEIEYPSSPVPLNSPLYINRPPIEELAYKEITKPGCVIRIKAPSKMGKSSLLNRIMAFATTQSYKVVSIDFQEADESVFSSLDRFLRWFCFNVSRKLQLAPRLDDYWDEDIGSKVSCKIYFEGYLLESLDSPLVLALNEVNRVFEHPKIAQDFLPMLRFWHELAQQAETWQRLRLVLVHSTEIYIQLKLTQSPFNVGLSLRLPEFTSLQVHDLAERYGLDWTEDEAEQLMAMVGGHPYLVSLAFYHLTREEITLQELLQTAATQAGIYSHHLRGHWAILREDRELAYSLQRAIAADARVELDAIAAYKLESMGLVQLQGNLARVSCELYRIYFRQQIEKEIGTPRSKDVGILKTFGC